MLPRITPKSEMTDQNLLDELRRAAENLGVAVRIERFETPAVAGGGRCILQGAPLVLIDAGAPVRDRIMTLARALAELETDTVFMVPEARAVVEAMRGGESIHGQRSNSSRVPQNGGADT